MPDALSMLLDQFVLPNALRDDRDEFSALKVAELRRLCEARGLESRVKRGLDARATLIERLRAQKSSSSEASEEGGG